MKNISLIDIANFITIFQALMMALISLRNNKSSHLSNNILASLLLIFAVINSRTLFLRVTTIELTPEHFSYFFIIGLLAFLTGPLLYFYIKSLLAPNYSLHKRDLIHSLPFVIAVIFAIFHFHRYISFFLQYSREEVSSPFSFSPKSLLILLHFSLSSVRMA